MAPAGVTMAEPARFPAGRGDRKEEPPESRRRVRFPALDGDDLESGRKEEEEVRSGEADCVADISIAIPTPRRMDGASTIQIPIRGVTQSKRRDVGNLETVLEKLESVYYGQQKLLSKQMGQSLDTYQDGLVYGELMWLRLGSTVGTLLLYTALVAVQVSVPGAPEMASDLIPILNLLFMIHALATAEIKSSRLVYIHSVAFNAVMVGGSLISIYMAGFSSTRALLDLVHAAMSLTIVLPTVVLTRRAMRQHPNHKMIALMVQDLLAALSKAAVTVLFFSAEAITCKLLSNDRSEEGSCDVVSASDKVLAMSIIMTTLLGFVVSHDDSFKLRDVICLDVEWRLVAIGVLLTLMTLIALAVLGARNIELSRGQLLPIVIAEAAFFTCFFLIFGLLAFRVREYFGWFFTSSHGRLPVEDDSISKFLAKLSQENPDALSLAILHVKESAQTSAELRSQVADAKIFEDVTVALPQGAKGPRFRKTAQALAPTGMGLHFLEQSAPETAPEKDAHEGNLARFQAHQRQKVSVMELRRRTMALEMLNSSLVERAASQALSNNLIWGATLLTFSIIFYEVPRWSWAIGSLIPRSIAHAGGGLAATTLFLHGWLAFHERKQTSVLLFIHASIFAVSSDGVWRIIQGQVREGILVLALYAAVCFVIIDIFLWHRGRVRTADHFASRFMVAFTCTLMPSALTIQFIWLFQGIACALQEYAGGGGVDELSYRCEAFTLSCTLVGNQAAVLVLIYVLFQGIRSCRGTFSRVYEIDIVSILNFDVPFKFAIALALLAAACAASLCCYALAGADALPRGLTSIAPAVMGANAAAIACAFGGERLSERLAFFCRLAREVVPTVARAVRRCCGSGQRQRETTRSDLQWAARRGRLGLTLGAGGADAQNRRSVRLRIQRLESRTRGSIDRIQRLHVDGFDWMEDEAPLTFFGRAYLLLFAFVLGIGVFGVFPAVLYWMEHWQVRYGRADLDGCLVSLLFACHMGTVDRQGGALLTGVLWAMLYAQKAGIAAATYMQDGLSVHYTVQDALFLGIVYPALLAALLSIRKMLQRHLDASVGPRVWELMKASVAAFGFAAALTLSTGLERAGYALAHHPEFAGTPAEGDTDYLYKVEPKALDYGGKAVEGQLIMTGVVMLFSLRRSPTPFSYALRFDMPWLETVQWSLLSLSWIISISMFGGRLQAGRDGVVVYRTLYFTVFACWLALAFVIARNFQDLVDQTLEIGTYKIVHRANGGAGLIHEKLGIGELVRFLT